jgi:four helix bundle protein
MVSSNWLVVEEKKMPEKHFKTHEDLIVWQKAIELAKKVYLLTRLFPKEETYGLTQQARRAAVSISANIAEGQGRNGRKEFAQFLRIARGSLAELRTYLVLSVKLDYTKDSQIANMLFDSEEIGRMLNALSKSLAGFPKHSTTY